MIIASGTKVYNDVDVEDAREIAEEAGKTATNYLNRDETGALVISNDVNDSNMRLDYDSIDIRRGDTVLAAFQADKIVLGKNSSDSTIEMCGRAFTIESQIFDLDSQSLILELTQPYQQAGGLMSSRVLALKVGDNMLGVTAEGVFCTAPKVRVNDKALLRQKVAVLNKNTSRFTNHSSSCYKYEALGVVGFRGYCKTSASLTSGSSYAAFAVPGDCTPSYGHALAISCSKQIDVRVSTDGNVTLYPREAVSSGYLIYVTGFWFI